MELFVCWIVSQHTLYLPRVSWHTQFSFTEPWAWQEWSRLWQRILCDRMWPYLSPVQEIQLVYLKYKGRLMVQNDKSRKQVMAWTYESLGWRGWSWFKSATVSFYQICLAWMTVRKYSPYLLTYTVRSFISKGYQILINVIGFE